MLTGILAAAHIIMTVGQKLLQLHNKGVDTEVIEDIEQLTTDFHAAIDKHHTNAGLKAEQEVSK